MVKDAEEHKEADKKFHELVDVRNQADAMIHATEKSIIELGDEVAADEKEKIEAAIGELKEAIKGNDKDAIDAKTTSLTEVSGELAERAYAKKGGAEAAGAEAAQAGAEEASAEKKDEDVVEAD